jgi:hypothetical protein
MNTQKLLTKLMIISVLLTISFGCKLGNLFGGISQSTDPKEAVTSAFKKFQAVNYYHSVTTTKNAQATVQTETDFNAPDKFWIKNSVVGTKSEVIVIGNESFSRLSEGKWTKMPDGQMSATEMRKTMSEAAIAGMKDFETVGKESLNGKDAFVYKIKGTYGGESASKVWIAVDSGLPVRVDTEGNFGGTNMNISIIYDYEKETKIETPKIN